MYFPVKRVIGYPGSGLGKNSEEFGKRVVVSGNFRGGGTGGKPGGSGKNRAFLPGFGTVKTAPDQGLDVFSEGKGS
jgi:hypothetical protein